MPRPTAEDMQTLENMYVERLQQPTFTERWRELTSAITHHRSEMGVLMNDDVDRGVYAKAVERVFTADND